MYSVRRVGLECVSVCVRAQRAALLAARDHPFPLDFAAEVGVNLYVKMSSTHILPVTVRR